MVLHSLYFFLFTFCLPNFAASSFFTPTLFFLFSLLLVIIVEGVNFCVGFLSAVVLKLYMSAC